MTTNRTAPIWSISTYRGLFRPATRYLVQAVSGFEAECRVQERLLPSEWFPTFSATRVDSEGALDEKLS